MLRELLVIVTARSANVPRVHPRDRITVDVLGYTDADISHATARFGFQEDPDIPGALRLAGANDVECDTTSKARPTSCRGPGSGSPTPPERIAGGGSSRSGATPPNPVEYLRLPDRRAITMGWEVPL